MSSRTLIWICLTVGSTVGGYAPDLFGAHGLSMWSLLTSSIGSVAGIFAGYKLGQWWGLS